MPPLNVEAPGCRIKTGNSTAFIPQVHQTQMCLPNAGVPFRETHHISGAAVKLAEDRDVTLFDLTVEDLKGIHPQFEEDVLQVQICTAQNVFLDRASQQLAAMLDVSLNSDSTLHQCMHARTRSTHSPRWQRHAALTH